MVSGAFHHRNQLPSVLAPLCHLIEGEAVVSHVPVSYNEDEAGEFNQDLVGWGDSGEGDGSRPGALEWEGRSGLRDSGGYQI